MEKINEVMGIVFLVDGASLKDTDTPDTVEAWDSVTHIILLTSLEDELSIKFTDEEMENLSSIGDIRKKVQEKTAGKST